MDSLFLLYRSHQVFHRFTEEMIVKLIPSLVVLSTALMIISITVVILYYDQFLIVMVAQVVTVFLITAFMLGYSLEMANKFSNATKEFYQRLKILVRENGNRSQKSIGLKRCRAMQEVTWHIGKNYTLQKSTFFIIMNNIVMENVINLVLAFGRNHR